MATNNVLVKGLRRTTTGRYTVMFKSTYLGLYATYEEAAAIRVYADNNWAHLSARDAYREFIVAVSNGKLQRPMPKGGQPLSVRKSDPDSVPFGVRCIKGHWVVTFRRDYLGTFKDYDEARKVRLWMEEHCADLPSDEARAKYYEAVTFGELPDCTRGTEYYKNKIASLQGFRVVESIQDPSDLFIYKDQLCHILPWNVLYMLKDGRQVKVPHETIKELMENRPKEIKILAKT